MLNDHLAILDPARESTGPYRPERTSLPTPSQLHLNVGWLIQRRWATNENAAFYW